MIFIVIEVAAITLTAVKSKQQSFELRNGTNTDNLKKKNSQRTFYFTRPS